MRKICVITGSRADYGLLSGLMKAIQQEAGLELQVIATNMHLSPEFGLTYQEIEKDGFRINKRVDMLLSSDTPNATTKSVGLATIGFADAYEDLQPDLIVVLGDRFELLAAVSAALFYQIPVAHLHGGEVTEGAYDDSIRHAITKMSHLHFTSTEEYRRRVIQLGEDPERVFYVGAIGLDNIRHLKLMDKETFESDIDFDLGEKNLLVTFHPVTLENNTAHRQFNHLLLAIDSCEYTIIFTKANSDTNGRVINAMIDEYVQCNPDNSIAFDSLGHLRYLSALQFMDMVIGNSSSGILEVPSFHIPTINIGDRQKGRLRASSVIDCEPTFSSIGDAMDKAFSPDFRQEILNTENPYEKAGTVNEIIQVLRSYPLEGITRKHFNNLV